MGQEMQKGAPGYCSAPLIVPAIAGWALGEVAERYRHLPNVPYGKGVPRLNEYFLVRYGTDKALDCRCASGNRFGDGGVWGGSHAW